MKKKNTHHKFGNLPHLAGWLLILSSGLLLAGCAAGVVETPAPTGNTVVEQPTTTPAEDAEDEEDTESEAKVEAEIQAKPQAIALDHIHGMGWDPSGEALTVATHTGLRIFKDNQWFDSKGPDHDYIALAPTASGFYASGIPAPSAPEGSPLGLVKSTDTGKTLEMLSFEGESEIHFLGAGYETDAVYVVIDAENSTVAPGLHYTLDDGESWQSSAAQGITAVTIQLAVHPTDPAIIAFGTEGGVLLSTDSGNSFERITESTPYSAVHFSRAEEGVLYFGLDTLMRLAPDGSDPVALNTPELAFQDAMIAIAVNPQNADEIAIATFDSSVWQTLDGGENWQLIGDPTAD
jgi:hypothetical protein